MDETRADPRVLGSAARQHGVITTAQLLAAGWDKDAIARRVARGWLRRVYRGVYLVGPLESPHSPAMAATLATRGVLSHYPAAVLWALRQPREGPMHVIAGGRSQANLVVHRAALHPGDITRRHGIPVTSAARTLLDVAAVEPAKQLDRALNEAEVQHRVSTHSLDEQFGRYPRHRGTAALKEAIGTEPAFTRSEAERRMLGLIRRAGLPVPETNVRIEGYEVDLVWRARRLAVEVDSWTFHSMRRSFEEDRRRDQHLVSRGWRVMRITWRQMEDEVLLVATLATALAA